MARTFEVQKSSGSGKIVAAAVVGAACGLAGTALLLGSLEFAIFGGIGGAVVAMIGALAQFEKAEV
jgi:hypothetical protein